MKTKKEITEQEKRAVYVQAFGKEFDSPNRKQSPLPIDIAYQVALSALKNAKKLTN